MFFYNIIENKNYKDLNPLSCGMMQCKPDTSFGPHIRNYYLIHFVISGKGYFKNENNQYKVAKDQAFIIKPDEVTKYWADPKDPWEYIWIGFDGELSAKINELKSPVIDIDSSFISSLVNVRNIVTTKEEYLVSKLFELFSILFDNKTKCNYAESVKNYIVTSYNSEITLEQIATSLNLDKRYLNRVFKNYFGITIKQYLIKTRMKEAQRLLKKGYLIKQAAFMTGYNDPFVFSRAFKEYYGFPPQHIITGKND